MYSCNIDKAKKAVDIFILHFYKRIGERAGMMRSAAESVAMAPSSGDKLKHDWSSV